MNKLRTPRRVAVVAALVEGNSIRATSRMTGVCKPTVLRLLAELGAACVEYHDAAVRGLTVRRLQCDEIWSFCYAKAKNVPDEKKGTFGYGDVWVWTALDADTKLMVSYLVGPRTPPMAYELLGDVDSRVEGGFQLTTDGLPWYGQAVENMLGSDVDYGIVQKYYGASGDSQSGRYSPARLTAVTKEVIKGTPDQRHISTSYVERQNLTMRMQMRRFTRLTNAFSKKLENHAAAVALHFLHYNFARVHKTLRVTPAMEAGLADHVWSLEEIVGLLDAAEKKAA
jgi:IS1 family transposase